MLWQNNACSLRYWLSTEARAAISSVACIKRLVASCAMLVSDHELIPSRWTCVSWILRNALYFPVKLEPERWNVTQPTPKWIILLQGIQQAVLSHPSGSNWISCNVVDELTANFNIVCAMDQQLIHFNCSLLASSLNWMIPTYSDVVFFESRFVPSICTLPHPAQRRFQLPSAYYFKTRWE